jgi:REP-associated tyrosine transposase
MSRPLRIEYEGACYHVTSRGNERRNIYKTDEDRIKFLEYLESACKKYEAIIIAYCLMTNHYHLLIKTMKANLGRFMHYINMSYTNYYNRKKKRSGHLLLRPWGQTLPRDK